MLTMIRWCASNVAPHSAPYDSNAANCAGATRQIGRSAFFQADAVIHAGVVYQGIDSTEFLQGLLDGVGTGRSGSESATSKQLSLPRCRKSACSISAAS